MAGIQFPGRLLVLQLLATLVGCCLAGLGHPGLHLSQPQANKDRTRYGTDDVGREKRTLDIRLAGTENGADGARSGRVEVYYDGAWGTVCDDDFRHHSAAVACRSLGYDSGEARPRAYFGEGSGMIWLDEVMCSGRESSLSECSHSAWGESNCRHSEDVGVQCSGIRDGDVRLAGEHSGRVEVFYNGEWGTVCDDGFDMTAARVVCSSIGYNVGVVAANSAGTGPIWLDDVNCAGHETSIDQCAHKPVGEHDCLHHEDVAVVCVSSGAWEPNHEGTVRLRDGPSESSGRLEIYHDGEWGTVCDDDFDDQEANVVCRMMGYSRGEAEIMSPYGAGTGPIWLDELECTGSEQQLSDCGHAGWRVENCHHLEDAGLTCH